MAGRGKKEAWLRGWNLSAAVIVLLAALVLAAPTHAGCKFSIRGLRLGMTKDEVTAKLKAQKAVGDGDSYILPSGWCLTLVWSDDDPPKLKRIIANVEEADVDMKALVAALLQRYDLPAWRAGNKSAVDAEASAWKDDECVLTLEREPKGSCLGNPPVFRPYIYLRVTSFEEIRQALEGQKQRARSILEDE